MIYFFINITLYLGTIIFLVKYFQNNMDITKFIIVLFDMNMFLFFIYQNINYIYGLLFLIVSLFFHYFVNLLNNNEKEIVLIQNGNINFHEVISYYSYHRLINYLKRHHIKIEEVSYCLKRGNKLTIIKDSKVIK